MGIVPKRTKQNPLNINEISKKVGFWNLMQNSSFNEIAIFKNEKIFIAKIQIFTH